MESGKLGMKNQSFSIFHFQLSIIKTPPTHCDEGIFFNVDQQGLEPRTNRLWAGCSNQLSYWSVFEIDRRFTRRSIVTPPTGLEPVTSWLTVMRSTDWAMEDYTIFKPFLTWFLVSLHNPYFPTVSLTPTVIRCICVHSHYRLSYGGLFMLASSYFSEPSPAKYLRHHWA